MLLNTTKFVLFESVENDFYFIYLHGLTGI